MAQTLGDINVLIGADLSRFEAAMSAVERGVGRLGEGLKTTGSALTVAITAPLTLLGGAALDAFGKIEKLQKGLTAVATQQLNAQGVTGIEAISQAATETASRLKELETLAKAPGLGFSQAVQGDIRLRAVGISAEQSAKSIKEFANAIATTGGGRGEFDRVTVQLGQLSAKGKVLAQDLRPIIEAAPAVAGALQKLYNTVDSEDISKALEKQGKSSKEFISDLTDELAKLPRVAGSFSDTVENFQESGTRALAKFGNALNKAFNLDANLTKLADFITGLADKFEALDPATQKLVFGLAAGAAAAGPLIFGFGAILSAIPSVVAGFEVLGIASTAALGPIGIAAAAVAAGAYLIIDNWDQLVDYFGTGGLGGQIFPNLAESIGNAAREIGSALAALGSNNLGGLISAGEVLKDLIRSIGVGFTALADIVGGTIGAVTRLLKGDFAGSLEQAKRAIFGLIDPLAGLFGFTKKGNTELAGSFAAAFQPIEEVTGLIGGDLAAALGKSTALTEEQQKALDKLQKQLLDNERASLAFGDSLTKTGEKYDFLGNKSKILESGIKSLTEVGFGPGGVIIQGFIGQLDRVPEAVDQAVARVAKGLESLAKTPAFELKLPDQLDSPELPQQLDSGLGIGTLISLDQAKKQGEAVELARQNYEKLTEAQKSAYQHTLDFNTNMEDAIDSLNSSIAPLLAGFAEQFGNAFGSVIVGTASAGDALTALFSGILGAIAGFMGDFGKQLVAIGIAKLGLDTLFAAGPAGGPAAIAAGLGLIALAGVATAVAKSASSSLGKVTGAGGGAADYSSPSAQNSSQQTTIKVVAEFKLRGQDLIAVGKLGAYRNKLTD